MWIVTASPFTIPPHRSPLGTALQQVWSSICEMMLIFGDSSECLRLDTTNPVEKYLRSWFARALNPSRGR
jgi:hypothetical protein